MVFRRTLVLLIATSALLVGGVGVQSASAHHKPGKCDFHWVNEEGYSTWGIKRIIRCAVWHYPVAGGADKALAVARCESRFNPYANGGPYKGVFQQASRYWDDRYRAFGGQYLAPGIYNGRTNILVSIRMAHRWGWGHWGCA
jgi:hypothetical protein